MQHNNNKTGNYPLTNNYLTHATTTIPRYVPMASVKSAALESLASQAWAMWEGEKTIAFKKLSATAEYKQLVQAHGDRGDIVAERVKCMVGDLRSLPTHEYLVRDGRIGYQEHDGVTFTASFGFKTMWAHFKEFHAGKVIERAMSSCFVLLFVLVVSVASSSSSLLLFLLLLLLLLLFFFCCCCCFW